MRWVRTTPKETNWIEPDLQKIYEIIFPQHTIRELRFNFGKRKVMKCEIVLFFNGK
jgi:hypothetical protein